MNNSVKLFIGMWLLVVACLARAASSEPYQSLTALQASAEQQVRSAAPSKLGVLRVQADNLDPRLRLAPCANTPVAFLPNGMNLGPRATVGVRCNEGAQWTVYVAVAIESEAPVLVLNRPVTHDTALTSADVEVSVRRLPGLSSGYLSDVSQLVGNSAKSDLATGVIMTPGMLQPTTLIRRGQQVTLLASVNGLEVRTEAVALSDGSANNRIRVKNLATAKVVEGIVDSASVVRVTL